jgi:SAM-dependent methyltransferase
MNELKASSNIDPRTVAGFGDEWARFDQSALSEAELSERFDSYFGIFPFDSLAPDAEGFDLGCGSGRWARLVAPRVGRLHCIDPSPKALNVARRVLGRLGNVDFHLASVGDIPLADESQDFGYCLGVLHHIPDTREGMRSCVRKLRPGAPFLVYLYYALDNRPRAFRLAWRVSDLGRRAISRLPFPLRAGLSNAIAATVYLPLARTARWLEKRGRDVENIPLSAYRNYSFYTMRTDALDRFGTRLEKRFSKDEVRAMMTDCGLVDIRFSDSSPYWVACGRKAK